MLAGLVQSPSRLAPSRNPDGAERRAGLVIAAMAEQKMISDDAAKRALAIRRARSGRVGAGSVNYVADWVMDAVDDLIGQVDQDIVPSTPRSIRRCRPRPSNRSTTRWRRRATSSTSARARW
jgi:penicillin-binding protein 1A